MATRGRVKSLRGKAEEGERKVNYRVRLVSARNCLVRVGVAGGLSVWQTMDMAGEAVQIVYKCAINAICKLQVSSCKLEREFGGQAVPSLMARTRSTFPALGAAGRFGKSLA